MKPKDLLEHFGTQTAIAKFFDISDVAVSKWFAEDEIPAGRQYEMQVKSAGKFIATVVPEPSK